MPNYVYNVSNLQLHQNTYTETSINSVNLRNVPWQNNSMHNSFLNCQQLAQISNINTDVTNMSYTFYNCQNLNDIDTIPNSVTNMYGTFWYCSTLENVPTIPNSVTDLSFTFGGCTNLINAPTIPNSVTNLAGTFYSCKNITTISDIPDNVINMWQTFKNSGLSSINKISNSTINLSETFAECKNLVTAPTIPNSITRMNSAFESCTNLTGDIYIYSNQVRNVANIFANTSLIKNTYIPFYNLYTNKIESLTYNAFHRAGYDEVGTQDNTYLKNLTPVLTVTTIPVDTTVTLEANGHILNEKEFVVPINTVVNWTVSKIGYVTQTGTETLTIDKTINVELIEKLVKLTIIPVPVDATVTLEAPDQTVTGEGELSIEVPLGTAVTYTVEKSGYETNRQTITVSTDSTITIVLVTASRDAGNIVDPVLVIDDAGDVDDPDIRLIRNAGDLN